MKPKLEVLAEFDHDEGHVRFEFDQKEYVLYFFVDSEQYSSHEIPESYASEILAEVISFESSFWENQHRDLEEIDYNLSQLETKLTQYPYVREKR